MSHDADAACGCVYEHRPPVLEYERHHIWPMYLGGADYGETVWLCQNTHANVHELLRLMLKSGQTLSNYELQQVEDRPVSGYAADLAREGYLRWRGAQT